MQIHHFIALSITALALTGCGESKPTDKDVQAFYKEQLGQCALSDVVDAKIENQIKEGENTYHVKTHFTFRMTPTPEIKSHYAAIINNNEEYSKLLDERKQVVPPISAKIHDLIQKRESNDINFLSFWDGQDAAKLEAHKRYMIDSQNEINALKTKYTELDTTYSKAFSQLEKPMRDSEIAGKFLSNYMKECGVKDGTLAAQIMKYLFGDLNIDRVIEYLTSGAQVPLTYELKLVKTEKGWKNSL